MLAQHFIRQARTRRDAHLKVLIRYHSTMSVIFIYLSSNLSRCDLCSFICFPSSSCPLQVCYSGILPLPFPFGSLCMVWDESWLFDHTYRDSVRAVIWYEAPKPVKWARAVLNFSCSLWFINFGCLLLSYCQTMSVIHKSKSVFPFYLVGQTLYIIQLFISLFLINNSSFDIAFGLIVVKETSQLLMF